MTLKLIYVGMDWGTFNQMYALEQVRGVIKAIQISKVDT